MTSSCSGGGLFCRESSFREYAKWGREVDDFHPVENINAQTFVHDLASIAFCILRGYPEQSVVRSGCATPHYMGEAGTLPARTASRFETGCVAACTGRGRGCRADRAAGKADSRMRPSRLQIAVRRQQSAPPMVFRRTVRAIARGWPDTTRGRGCPARTSFNNPGIPRSECCLRSRSCPPATAAWP